MIRLDWLAMATAVALVATLAPSCAGCGPAAICNSTDDCTGQQRCIEKRCRQNCASDDGCAADERCVYGACLPVGASCGAASDCLGIEVCVSGSCRLTCRTSTDCLADQDCVGGICAPRVQPGLDAAGVDARLRDGAGFDVGGRDVTGPDVTSRDVPGRDVPGRDTSGRDATLLDGAAWPDTQQPPDTALRPDAMPPFDGAPSDNSSVTTDAASHDATTTMNDSSRPDLDTGRTDAAVADAWACMTVPCSSTDLCCRNGCSLPRGTDCNGMYCNGAGACVECLADLHCSDGDRCTLDVCLASGFCESSSARESITRTTVWGTDGFCESGVSLGYQRVEAICSNWGGNLMNSRGFLSFDTSVVPSAATITGVELTLCRTGGPGAELAELYLTTFGLNLTCDAFNHAVVFLQSLPDGSGPFTVGVESAAVAHGGNTQFQIRYPVTDCGVDTWYGKRWRSATGPIDGNCDEGDAPRLNVNYCTAPY